MASNLVNTSCAVLHYTANRLWELRYLLHWEVAFLSATITGFKLRSVNISVEPYVPLHYTAKGCRSVSYLLHFRIADKPF